MHSPILDNDRSSWSRLIGDHDRIAKLCFDLVALTQRRGLPCAAASRRLIELAVLVADHLDVEDAVIQRTGSDTGLEALRADWKIFIARWLPAITPSGWLAFGIDARAMLARLTDQVGRESELLYVRALNTGVIRLGSTVVH